MSRVLAVKFSAKYQKNNAHIHKRPTASPGKYKSKPRKGLENSFPEGRPGLKVKGQKEKVKSGWIVRWLKLQHIRCHAGPDPASIRTCEKKWISGSSTGMTKKGEHTGSPLHFNTSTIQQSPDLRLLNSEFWIPASGFNISPLLLPLYSIGSSSTRAYLHIKDKQVWSLNPL